MKVEPGTVKIVNKTTGEILEFAWETLQELKTVYLQLSSLESVIKGSKKKMRNVLDKALGEEEKYDFGDGYTLIRVAPQMKEYPTYIVAKYLDADQLDLVTKIDNKKLEEIIKELVESNSLEPGAWQDIQDNAEIKPIKPYVKIQKG